LETTGVATGAPVFATIVIVAITTARVVFILLAVAAVIAGVIRL